MDFSVEYIAFFFSIIILDKTIRDLFSLLLVLGILKMLNFGDCINARTLVACKPLKSAFSILIFI